MEKEIYENLTRQIKYICLRPGMFTGDLSLGSLQIYIQGLFHGIDICGVCTFDEWRQWVYRNYNPGMDASWMTALLNELGSKENVIRALPKLIEKFADEI